MKINASKLLMAFCMLLLLALVIFAPGIKGCLFVSLAIAVLFALVPIDEELAILFFAVNFIAAMNRFMPDVPLGSVLELIFILKCTFGKKLELKWTQVFLLLGVLAVSLLSSILLSLSLIKSLVFLVNLFLLLSAFGYTKSLDSEQRPESVRKYYLSFIFSLIAALIISLVRTDLSEITYYNRFIGLWTDPNFIGMFIILGLAMVLILAKNKFQNYLLALPVTIFLLSCGYMTYSRTFAIAVFLIVACLIFNLLKSKNVNKALKALGVIAVLVAAFFVYKYYLSGIFAARGVLDETGRDLTNGRLDDWHRAWVAYTSSPVNLVFGSGSVTSHNTLFDLFLKYGPLCAVLVLWFLISLIAELLRYKKERNLSILPFHRILYLVLIVYILTLPMMEDDLLYLLLGCIPLCYAKTDPLLSKNTEGSVK